MFFVDDKDWLKFYDHIVSLYPKLLNDDMSFYNTENSKGITTTSFSISITRNHEISGLDFFNKRFEAKFNCRFIFDILSDSPSWSTDLLLITNDIVNNTNKDCLLLRSGEYILLLSKQNEIFVDKEIVDYYPFDILSKKWIEKDLGWV